MGFAVAEVLASAISGADCKVDVDVCAQSGLCVGRFQECSGPGIDGMIACCDAGDVCTSLFGSPAFRCERRDLVGAMPPSTFETMECNA